jgi:hypothetical protein
MEKRAKACTVSQKSKGEAERLKKIKKGRKVEWVRR